MLREPFIHSLVESFPLADFKFFDEANRIASLPMPNGHGELSIHDDGDELTFFLGDITHCHFSQDYLGDGKYSPEAETIEDAVDYLRDLFSDQVVFYRARNGGRDGSIQCPSEEKLSRVLADCNCFVWSASIEPNTEQDEDGKTSPAIS
ncbi:MAG: hypothetical protein V4675_01110 [Verrucomicrobiota bacterium]